MRKISIVKSLIWAAFFVSPTHVMSGGSDQENGVEKEIEWARLAFDDEPLVERMKSNDGAQQSYGRTFPRSPSNDGIAMGVWKADAGTFTGKSGAVEYFVILEGEGSIQIDGLGEFSLTPGTVITQPANALTQITVVKPMRKVWWARLAD